MLSWKLQNFPGENRAAVEEPNGLLILREVPQPKEWDIPVYWRLALIRMAIATLGGTSLIATLCAISNNATVRTDGYSCAIVAAVNVIACYHYYAIYKIRTSMLSSEKNVSVISSNEDEVDLVRHVDWCLTLPLMVIDLYRLSQGATGGAKSWMNDNIAASLAFVMVVLGVVYRFSANVYLRAPAFVVSCVIFGFVVHAITSPIHLNKCNAPEGRCDTDGDVEDERAVLIFTYVWIGYPLVALASSVLPWGDVKQLSVLKDAAYAVLDIFSKAGLAFFVAYRTLRYA